MTMRTPATTALLAPPERPSTASAANRSGAPPGESPFAALLSNDRARTATAEGLHRDDSQRETRAGRPDDVRADRPAERDSRARGDEHDARQDAAARTDAPAEPRDPANDPALGSP